MTTTYRAAFCNPHAQRVVVSTITSKPDTSNDAALAAALAEEEELACDPSHEQNHSASPSGVKLNIAPWDGNKPSSSYQQQESGRLQQLRTSSSQQTDSGIVSDAELASHLQRVELAAVQDATGAPSSLIFPDLMSVPSSRERTLSRKLSRAPSQLVSPHVLAAACLPPEPVVSADRQRLVGTLQLYDLVELQVAGDGNCQFRALSDQLYGTPDYHTHVREAVVATLMERGEAYRGYVPGEYGEYCGTMARIGTWGDHVTLQAAADTYGMRIVVVTSFAASPVVHIEPAEQRFARTLYLSFWAEVHYNSLYPMAEPPPSQPPHRQPGPHQPPQPPPSQPAGRSGSPHPPSSDLSSRSTSSSASAAAGGAAAGGAGEGAKVRKVLGSRMLGRVVGGVGGGHKRR